ncbi:Amidohydrolase 2 [Cinnamomum micranthum f. kanehirae]|uniref:Amidohydrolase 2 n=1 Tax=Cinnamomum micranthum f. kanehirae TaxID=337451 RepID=A0A443PSV8_9MAGN|nr:Amidohydrolase 2 [Cinnamomum micranthum f. kanehirae]
MERYGELREAVEKVEVLDAHAHNLVDLDSTFPFIRCFSEAEGDALSFTPHSLSFKRSLRDIARLYGCEATLSGVETHRKSSGLHSICSKCFEAAKISAIFFDDGFESDKMHAFEWHSCYAPAVGRILRIERLAEQILDEEMCQSKWTLDKFTDAFMTKLKSYPLHFPLEQVSALVIVTVADKVVALKSIAAYRSGLEIDTHVSKKDAEQGLIEVLSARKPVRIQNKGLIDYIFTRSMEVSLSFNLPMQIHTGFGDKDLDLRLCNPLHLRTLLEDNRFSECRIVLLHASYPYSKEASYLASTYSQVYLDFGLAIPKLSVQGMISAVKELLDLAPTKKVMFSTDGYAFPETFYLGAKRAREIILSVLSTACDDGDLTIPEAIEAVEDIFKQNACRLYDMNRVMGSLDSKKASSSNSLSIKSIPPPEDIVFVRILWVDASGQHRCRVVPVKRFYEFTWSKGVGLTFASMGMSSSCDGPADGTNLTAVGEIRLVPDLSTKKRLPWSPREEMVLADMKLKPGEAWEYCPREALRRVSKVLKDEFNLEMNSGFENEFYLLKNVIREGGEEWVPFDRTAYCSTSGFDAASPILQEVNSAIESMDVFIEQLHAESGNGQFEIALGHTICTRAADNLIFAREVIRAVARKHGLLATFVPNYDRIQPNTWSGAYHCWGKENREAPLRTAAPPGVPDGLVSNFEIKSFDGCANPHLGLASIMAAGIDGLRRNLTLPQPIERNPSASDAERLPNDLCGSVKALYENKILKGLIGEKLVTAVIGVRKAEIEYYSKNKDAYKQLIHRY